MYARRRPRIDSGAGGCLPASAAQGSRSQPETGPCERIVLQHAGEHADKHPSIAARRKLAVKVAKSKYIAEHSFNPPGPIKDALDMPAMVGP